MLHIIIRADLLYVLTLEALVDVPPLHDFLPGLTTLLCCCRGFYLIHPSLLLGRYVFGNGRAGALIREVLRHSEGLTLKVNELLAFGKPTKIAKYLFSFLPDKAKSLIISPECKFELVCRFSIKAELPGAVRIQEESIDKTQNLCSCH